MQTITAPSLRTGRIANPAPLFVLSWTTETGTQRRDNRPARAIETLGRLLSRAADRGEAWNIQVLNADGADVTSDFACFQD